MEFAKRKNKQKKDQTAEPDIRHHNIDLNWKIMDRIIGERERGWESISESCNDSYVVDSIVCCLFVLVSCDACMVGVFDVLCFILYFILVDCVLGSSGSVSASIDSRAPTRIRGQRLGSQSQGLANRYERITSIHHRNRNRDTGCKSATDKSKVDSMSMSTSLSPAVVLLLLEHLCCVRGVSLYR